MPTAEPPAALTASPARQVIPPGTLLWRVHSRLSSADEFSSDVEPAGRFDAPDGGYRSMYVSFHETTAVAEQLLRGRKFTSTGKRTLPPSTLTGMVASLVRTTTELTLLRLVFESDFLALRQSDEWLATAEEKDYPRTRRWAAWLRDRTDVHGIVWQSTEDMPRQTAVIFGDRCGQGALRAVPATSIALDDANGASWLAEVLHHYRLQVSMPKPAEGPLVFLNYRSSDDTAVVELLDRELVSRLGEQAVFRDHRSIPPGTHFEPQLIENVERSKVLLVLIGRYWEGINGRSWLDDPDDWVRREIAAAFEKRVRVVPVLVGARGMLDAEKLPDDIRALVKLQLLTLRHRFTDRDVVALVDELFATVPALSVAHRAHVRRTDRQ